MKNISLTKLSITVVVAALASNFVFASNELSNVVAKVESSAPSFSQLIADYDLDKNNTLSIDELAKNVSLSKIFTKVDANSDQQISEQEFAQYLQSLNKSLS